MQLINKQAQTKQFSMPIKYCFLFLSYFSFFVFTSGNLSGINRKTIYYTALMSKPSKERERERERERELAGALLHIFVPATHIEIE